jgi:glycosyltransferase involved in cell wall biosynthesis
MRVAFRTVEKAMARWTDHFVTVSECDRRRGVELGLFPEERATVIRAGIDLAAFSTASGGAAVRELLGIPSQAPLVTQIGNFKPQKAPLDFVRVAAVVAAQCPEAWYVMVGDGPLRPAAEELARSLGVADQMVFCGWWDDVPALLETTTVSVLTSVHEGLPCSVVEALAAGVPVVATAVDGTPEVIAPGVNGYLAPVGDIGALAQFVCRLLNDPDERARMADAAREGLGDFDRDFMVQQQEELYRWIGRSYRS